MDRPLIVAWVLLLLAPAMSLATGGMATTDGALTEGGSAFATDPVTVLPATLPSGRSQMALAAHGDVAYLMGGLGAAGALDEVLRFDAATESLTSPGFSLPSARYGSAAAWHDGAAYLFGGVGADGGKLAEIVKVDPAAGTSAVLPVALPSVRSYASAFSDGALIHLLGGDGADGEILRFDPATLALTVVNATVSSWDYDAALLWDGSDAWLLGGWDGVTDRYDPAAGTLSTHPESVVRLGMAAAWSNDAGYLLGGPDDAAQVTRFSPSGGVTVMHGALPSPRSGATASASSGDIYVFGGAGPDGPLAEVLRYAPADDLPNATPVVDLAEPGTHECTGSATEATLDARATADADGDALTFLWEVFPSTGALLSDPQAPVTHLTLPGVGTRTAQLSVSDGRQTVVAQAPVTVTDTELPTLTLSDPAEDAFYLFDERQPAASPLAYTLAIGRLTLRAEATDGCAVAHVRFETTAGLDRFDTQPPYETVVNPPAADASPGVVTLTVKARDAGGNLVQAFASFHHLPTRLAEAPEACAPLAHHPACASLLGEPSA